MGRGDEALRGEPEAGDDAVLARWPAAPPLRAGQVQLWWRRDEEQESLPWAHAWLSAAEREREARFRFERLRASFRRRQAFLRGVLARHLGRAPGELELAAGERGKPFLAGDASGLAFNLSHSERWIVVAVARDLEVGVDVQARLPLAELEAMARQIMSTQEHAAFALRPSTERPRLFYRLWARKEAVLKASGLGLHREPSTLHVGFEDLGPGEHLVPRREEEWDGVHAVSDLSCPVGYEAAVAARGAGWSVRVVLGPE